MYFRNTLLVMTYYCSCYYYHIMKFYYEIIIFKKTLLTFKSNGSFQRKYFNYNFRCVVSFVLEKLKYPLKFNDIIYLYFTVSKLRIYNQLGFYISVIYIGLSCCSYYIEQKKS